MKTHERKYFLFLHFCIVWIYLSSPWQSLPCLCYYLSFYFFIYSPSHSLCEIHTHTHTNTRSDFAFRYENVSMLLRYLTVKNKNTMRVKLRIKINHNKVQSVYFLRPKLPLKYLSITTKE